MELHVVIAPIPMHGHTIPAMKLARRIADVGINVTFICYKFRIEQLARSSGADGYSSIQFLPLCRNVPPEQPVDGHDSSELVDWVVSRLGGEEDAPEFEDLLRAMVPAPSCIISDLSWTQQVAFKIGIPQVAFHPSTAQDLAVAFYAKELFSKGAFPSSGDELVQVPGISEPVPGAEIFSVTTPVLQDFFKLQSDFLHQSAGVLSSSFYELEPEAFEALGSNPDLNPSSVPFAAIGPLVMPGTHPSEEPRHELLKWLDSQAPASVLFISFGSFAHGSREQMEQLATAILSVDAPFLWVLHRDAILPDGFEDASKGKGIIYTAWAPQLSILSHASVGGFVTHCGWNSIMESICNGIPMGVIPFYDEQRANARIVVQKLGIGVQLCDSNSQLERTHVGCMLTKLMLPHSHLRRAAAELQTAAKRAAEDAPRRLLCFLKELSK